MRRTLRQIIFVMVYTVICTIAMHICVLADNVTTATTFSIPRNQSGPFVKQLLIKAKGRIVLDVTSLPKNVEVSLALRRPDGTIASQISGAGGNLSLTYFATEREVKESLAAKNIRWSVEISKQSTIDDVSGRLKSTHPGE